MAIEDDSEWELSQLQELQQQIMGAIEKSIEAHKQSMYQRKRVSRQYRPGHGGVTIPGSQG
jgi:hypothetical protein